MFHPDHLSDLPSGDSLLAQFGIRPGLVREVVEHDRAIRCPERAVIWPDRRFADFAPVLPDDHGLHEAGPDEPWDPAPAQRPADRRWRRA